MNLTETNRLVMGALNRRIITVMHDHSAESKERILKGTNQFVRTEMTTATLKHEITFPYLRLGKRPRHKGIRQRGLAHRTKPKDGHFSMNKRWTFIIAHDSVCSFVEK